MTTPDDRDRHALRLIEFHRALDLVAAHASSELGARRVRDLRPLTDLSAATENLAAADDMTTFLLRTAEWAPPSVPDVHGPLRRLRIEGASLDEKALAGLAQLLDSSHRARADIRRRSVDFRRITALADELCDLPEERERLGRSFDPEGNLADRASPALARLRRQMRGDRSALVARLERFALRLPERHRVPDASVTVRGGRYCVPVRREGRSAVGGIVHDESASGQTLFVEPAEAIEPMNRIRELELDERREIARILAALTELLRPSAQEMARSLSLLVELDSLYARARYALAHGGSRPTLDAGDGASTYRVCAGAHPLLREAVEPVVPFDLELRRGETALLVSGPNAGGKTVLLKAIGLFSTLAQSGIVPPVGDGTRLPLFRRFFAILGDEQSIDASLSTFSAQVQNLRTILEQSDRSSLVLIDEIGSNTDPAEGAALAAAVLLRLADQAALSVVSTHLGALKTLAGEDERIVNASLQFDSESLRPTYRLVRDRPGRSYALEISERLGIPAAVVSEARGRLSSGERSLESVLGDLERREEELGRLTRRLQSDREALDRLRARVEVESARLAEREVELERRTRSAERDAREKAESYLLQARQDVQRAIERLELEYHGVIEGLAAADEAVAETERVAKEARSAVERSLRTARERTPAAETAVGPTQELRPGDRVRIRAGGSRGRVEEIRGESAVVEAGGLRLTLPIEGLTIDTTPEKDAAPRAGAVRVPSSEARSEVDLRGLRAEEIEAVLTPALDDAILADLPSLRIIHGKGTGALRVRVQELLEADPRISSFRLGEHGEGGSGVTVVDLEAAD